MYGPPPIVIVVQEDRTPGVGRETREHDPPIAFPSRGRIISFTKALSRMPHRGRVKYLRFYTKGPVSRNTGPFVT